MPIHTDLLKVTKKLYHAHQVGSWRCHFIKKHCTHTVLWSTIGVFIVKCIQMPITHSIIIILKSFTLSSGPKNVLCKLTNSMDKVFCI